MRYSLILLLPMVLVTVTGCPSWNTQKIFAGSETALAQGDGLVVKLELVKRSFAPGEMTTAVVTVGNVSKRPIVIRPGSGAQAWIIIERYQPGGPVEVKRYPQLVGAVQQPWVLEPGEARQFPMSVLVEPDWPTHEPLRMVGRINGLPDLGAAITIEVLPQPYGT